MAPKQVTLLLFSSSSILVSLSPCHSSSRVLGQPSACFRFTTFQYCERPSTITLHTELSAHQPTSLFHLRLYRRIASISSKSSNISIFCCPFPINRSAWSFCQIESRGYSIRADVISWYRCVRKQSPSANEPRRRASTKHSMHFAMFERVMSCRCAMCRQACVLRALALARSATTVTCYKAHCNCHDSFQNTSFLSKNFSSHFHPVLFYERYPIKLDTHSLASSTDNSIRQTILGRRYLSRVCWRAIDLSMQLHLCFINAF